jgi:hypothetical protein
MPASMISRGRAPPPPQAIMSVERELHMATGDGENSYAANSIFQVRAQNKAYELLSPSPKKISSFSLTNKSNLFNFY